MKKKKILYFLSLISYYLHLNIPLSILFEDLPFFLSSTSYYKDEVRAKSKSRIFFEQLLNVFKHGGVNRQYFLYGFDKYHDSRQYVDNTLFDRRRDFLNQICDINHLVLLRDKLLFSYYAEINNIPTPIVRGVLSSNGYYDLGNKTFFALGDFSNQVFEGKYVLKLISGECADGVYFLEIKDGGYHINNNAYTIDKLKQLVGNNIFILQDIISSQHEGINMIFSKSINTIRLVTVFDKRSQTVIPFSAVLRVGSGTNNVDNWAAGGLAIGIEMETGKLRKYGFYKPKLGTMVDRHPDTGFSFEGYKLPYWEDALKLALSFHEKLKDVHSIGWDIAITSNGPFFIEGNDNWEITLMQACNGGLKEKFDEFFRL